MLSGECSRRISCEQHHAVRKEGDAQNDRYYEDQTSDQVLSHRFKADAIWGLYQPALTDSFAEKQTGGTSVPPAGFSLVPLDGYLLR